MVETEATGAADRGTPSLLARYGMQPDAIYARSFAQIDELLAPLGLSPAQHHVVRRIVHATGDPDLAHLVRFHPGAIAAALAALRAHHPVVVDVRMTAAGLNAAWLAESACPVHCAIEAPAAAARAGERSITRSAAAIELLAPMLDGAIVAVGNAPTALLALLDMIDSDVARPAVIVGMPVGFVAAAESKDELMARDVPWISIPGLRGGSPATSATLNALLRLALDDHARGPEAETARGGGGTDGVHAVLGVLLGRPDESFARRGPTTNLITKQEVRAVALARLGLRRASVVWDVGTGSGSVGIEAALVDPAGRVYGIDRHPEAVAVAAADARTHGAVNFVACAGEAPEALAGLPDPDAVFVGGSGGRLAAILDAVAARLRPHGRVVVSLITLEHLHEATAHLIRNDMIPEVALINVARSRPVGELTRLEALNPVYLIAATRGPRQVGP
ncbi:MAG: hypothetical protein NVSMB65_07030 [Chloroflexota bacterium]